jgi:uncharacterized protein YecE (DUF72 family)
LSTRAGDAVDPLSAAPPLPSLRKGPMPARVRNLRLGTASWTDRTLLESGAFYPRRVSSPEQRLRYYARHFPVVEVDASFYALPASGMAKAWVERTPRDFSFGVKAFAAMTQHPFVPARLPREMAAALSSQTVRAQRLYPRDLPAAALERIWELFRAGIEPLHAAGVLGYVLLQFPKWFPRTRENVAYLEECRQRLPDVPLAVEFREPSWLAERSAAATLDLLRRNAMIYVSVDEPQGTRASVPPIAAVTSEELAVVRFHGRNAQTWTKPGVGVHERFRYLYGEAELRGWRDRLNDLAGKTREVHVLMNNCYGHAAVQNAKDLATLLAES